MIPQTRSKQVVVEGHPFPFYDHRTRLYSFFYLVVLVAYKLIQVIAAHTVYN